MLTSWDGFIILLPKLSISNRWLTHFNIAERAYPFNKRVVLPIINADSMQIQTDSYGNMIWTWQIPAELGRLSFNHKTRARASIDIYKNKKNIAYFSIILPVHMGYALIPNDVVQKLNQKGGRFELKVSLETRDKNNRTYSKPYIMNHELTAMVKWVSHRLLKLCFGNNITTPSKLVSIFNFAF